MYCFTVRRMCLERFLERSKSHGGTFLPSFACPCLSPVRIKLPYAQSPF